MNATPPPGGHWMMERMQYEQIWLIGFMGTGKSRTVRALAAALDWTPLDLDTLIEQEAGEGIPDIFTKGGEAAFRVLESQIVERIAGERRVVIATGGGTILSDTNRSLMKQQGFVACLDARPETIAARIADSGDRVSDRPLLAGHEPHVRIAELMAERAPLYAQTADFIIQTDDMTPDQVTHQILLAFRERAAVAGGAA
jgi:shikimate kinase